MKIIKKALKAAFRPRIVFAAMLAASLCFFGCDDDDDDEEEDEKDEESQKSVVAGALFQEEGRLSVALPQGVTATFFVEES